MKTEMSDEKKLAAIRLQCFRMLRNVHDAEDAAQSAYVRALGGMRPQWNGVIPLPFLRVAARCVCVDMLRGNGRHDHYLKGYADMVNSGDHYLSQRDENLIFVRQLMDCPGVTHQDMEIAIAVWVDEETQEEAAQEYGMPRSTVRDRLARLRQILADYSNGGKSPHDRGAMERWKKKVSNS